MPPIEQPIEQPRNEQGQFVSHRDKEFIAATRDLAEIRHVKPTPEQAEEAFSKDQTEEYQKAHDREVAKKQAKPESVDQMLERKLHEAQLRNHGLAALSDDQDVTTWLANRRAQIAAGEPTRIEDAQGNPVEAEVAERETEQAEAAPDTLEQIGIEKNHPHRQRMEEAKEWYGNGVLEAVSERLSHVPVSPGVMKMIADFENGVDMLVELSNHETPEQIGAYLSILPREQARQYLTEVSKGVASKGIQQEQPQPKAAKPKPPEPVVARSSTAFDPNDDSMSADEWQRRRNEAIRSKRGGY